MELLNILAQVVVIIGIFLWTVLKGLWYVLFATWEITRDYSPLIAKKAWNLLKKAYFFSRKWTLKLTAWISAQTATWTITKPAVIEPIQAMALPQVRFQLPSVTLPKPHLPKVHPKVFSKLSLASMVVSFVALFFIFFPDLVLAIIPYQTAPIESAVDQSALGGTFADGNLYSTLALPDKNEYLPDGNWLVIPKIGVLTQINEESTENHEAALEKGVWRVPEFAEPTAGKNYPTILVAHKFGYLAWSNKFRHQNSFYNLEKLEIGDTFDVIWDHRKFTYEIYAGEEGKEITDYKADIVLYTCKYLNSPARIFRYARRVEY